MQTEDYYTKRKALFGFIAPIWYTQSSGEVEPRGIIGCLTFPLAVVLTQISNWVLSFCMDDYQPGFPIKIYED